MKLIFFIEKKRMLEYYFKKYANAKYFIFACIIFTLHLSTLSAQNPSEFRKLADKAYSAGLWAEALSGYAQYQEAKPGDAEVLTRLGICQFHLRRGDKAQQYLEFVFSKNPDSKDPDLYYYLGQCLHGNGEYERAIAAYKGFLKVSSDKHPFRANALDNIKRCAYAQYLPDNPEVALVENLSDRVNSTGDDFAPLLSRSRANRLYFAAARPGSAGGRRNEQGYEDEVAGQWCSDIYFADQSSSGWNYAAPLNSLINTSRNEVALGFSPDGQILYYFRGFTLYSGDVFADTAGTKDEYATLPPAFNSPMRPEEGEVCATFLNNDALIFAGRRPEGYGGLDLYYSTRSPDGEWSTPQNLGPEINSAYDETTPFLSANGQVLYFSSNRKESIGGLDVFRALYDPGQQRFSAPQNMGAPLNSPFDDAWFQISADGNTGFLASNRFGSLGERDLYIAYFLTTREEQTETGQPFFLAALSSASGGSSSSVALPQMFYTDERDILKKENLPVVDQVADLARRHPEATVMVTVHTHESGPSKFDLYYGIKRAEIVGKALVDRGLLPERVSLLSTGPFYPQALNALNGMPNSAGQALNRRITFRLIWPTDQAPVTTYVPKPDIPEQLFSAAERQFTEKSEGYAYKVEVAVSRQLLNNDALGMFNDQHIESVAGTGEYHYTVGWVRTYSEAAALRKELIGLGFNTSVVAPYRNGVRISRAEAVKYLKQYPDLGSYLRG